ncbi:uncharacterized protein MKK02DRAFT_30860 [Dioszegia hungarica]|uniref:Uncharacterized protein n=1 Tax=Dioszegia hungarica TaxID=4972 RepID=A0AA38H406_9TREE|nr:uncharacterized protein MKK02DRAFT_30860 [Dioszegia hungarica]KAI9631869.1 hypothetical protein MKK02DRAFT_30860 [Dioszegia hungarica]
MLIFIFPMIPLLSAITVAAQAVAPSVVMGVTPIQLQSSITTTPSIGPSSSAAHDVLAVTVTRFRGGNRPDSSSSYSNASSTSNSSSISSTGSSASVTLTSQPVSASSSVAAISPSTSSSADVAIGHVSPGRTGPGVLAAVLFFVFA